MKYTYQPDPLIITANSPRFIDEVVRRAEYAPMLTYNTVLDLGANVGTFSFFIYPFANNIYAVDPSKENLAFMLETIRENELTKIHPFNLAIGNYNGTGMIDVYQKDDHGGNWKLNLSGSKELAKECEVRTLSTFMEENKIDQVDLLKIDVEGEEERIFRSEDFINVAGKIKLIIGEVHSDCSVEEILKERGFHYESYPNNHFKAIR